jgi:NAD(P)-dependent dehydrogenase (short-subunit alcohol dehydrogenase family)
MDQTGKVVVITGGASGMGEACAHAFSAAGGAVVVADRDEKLGRAVAEAITSKGGKAAFIKTDVTDERATEAMVKLAVDRFGGLDCAVNSAGVGRTPTKIKDLTAEEWRINLDIMLLGVAFSMKYEITAMLARGGGSIVNIASSGGLEGVPMMGAYVAAKHGVVGITRTAALEHATDGIRVNAICPGLIDTPMFRNAAAEGADWSEITKRCPMYRFGKPSEIADATMWLLSDQSSFVTGQTISVDGGLLSGPTFGR